MACAASKRLHFHGSDRRCSITISGLVFKGDGRKLNPSTSGEACSYTISLNCEHTIIWYRNRTVFARALMTCAYGTFFVLVWGSAVLAIPTIIGLFVWLVLTLVNDEFDEIVRIILLSVSIVLLIVWTVGLRGHAYRVLIRSGAFPAWCRGDYFPHDEVEVRQAVIEMKQKIGRNPAIVGGGWGFYLKRYGPPAPRVFTHEFKGQMPNEPNRWRSGSTIATVVKHYEKQGLTLQCHPTMDYISIGSWASHCNHGNAGDASSGVHTAFDTITVLDMDTNSTQRVDYRTLRRLFDTTNNRYMVIDMSFKLVPDRQLQKRGILVSDPQSAAKWLAPGAVLRVCFLGGARDYAIGLRWEAPYNDTDHRDPHFCSRFCQFFQTDVCSIACGCHETMSEFEGKISLINANRWVPPIFPFMTIGVICSGILNFEVFFKLPESLNGNVLSKFVLEAIRFHKQRGGRSEIRYGKPSAATTIHWDISLQIQHFGAAFELLANTLDVTECAIHPGKHDVASTAPLERITCFELYYGGVL